MGDIRNHQVAQLHDLDPDVQTWWALQLARLPAQFDVLGFSLGAVLALQLLGMAPQRVRRLVLVAGNPSAGTASHFERVSAQRALWQSLGPASVATQMLEEASPTTCNDPTLRKCVVDMACDTPTSAFIAQGEVNVTRPDGLPFLAHWHGPLLLVSGSEDPWCGADKQALVRSVRPDAQWCELPHCGHYVPLEQPLALAKVTCSFFLDTDSTQRPTT